MTVRIRLTKTGSKKKIKRRIVVADSRSPRDGRFIELLGYWDPNQEPTSYRLDLTKTDEWLKKGAQPSETVRNIIKKARREAV
ncbi:MAG: small subunit ribosomal protein S16 [Candidatus Omnitrophota bacterium]|jgi:small subunit ribosomal protein S16